MKEITKEWISLAKDDLKTVAEIIHRDELSNVASFYSQQCVEKLMKGILEEKGIRFLKTHNFIKLYEETKKIVSLDIEKDTLDLLNKIYIDSRYPGELGLAPYGKSKKEDAELFYTLAEKLYDKIEAFLKRENSS